MKISIASLLAVILIPSVCHGEIYAQSGYEEGHDGILLLTEKCPGVSPETGFKLAVTRASGKVMSGCYVKNNRGNFIIKWENGNVVEVPSNIFNNKESRFQNPTSNSESDINQTSMLLTEPSNGPQLFAAARKIATSAQTPPLDEITISYVTALGLTKPGNAPPFALGKNKLWPEFIRLWNLKESNRSTALVETDLGRFLIVSEFGSSGQSHLVLAIDLSKKTSGIIKSSGTSFDMQTGPGLQRLPISAALAWHASVRIEQLQSSQNGSFVSEGDKKLMVAGYLTALEDIMLSSISSKP